jgi:pimeloyl-ACP methyl ester carboxylesterase
MRGSADCLIVAEVPETRFAETPGGRIAYQVIGHGPIDVLVTHTPMFPIDLRWDEPSLVRFLDGLSSFSRHVWFDSRGQGASDPLPHEEERFAEAIADDMLALLDHLGWEQVALVGDAQPQILFAATHPERTKALVLLNAGAGVPKLFREGVAATTPTDLLDQLHRNWGTGLTLELVAPSVAGDAQLRRWLGRSQRLLCTADEMYWRSQASFAMDMRPRSARFSPRPCSSTARTLGPRR